MDHPRQPMLDAVRGVAILLVLGFHFRQPFGIGWLDAMAQPVFAIGWIGVDLFFVLSGFLVGRHLLAEIASPAGLDRHGFVLRRAVRLWPTLWLYLFTLVALGGQQGLASIWPVLLHVQNYVSHAPSHLWSLAVEEHFYLLAALALPTLWRMGQERAVATALVALLLACLASRLLALTGGVPLTDIQWQTHYRLDAPAFGVLLASWSNRLDWVEQVRRRQLLLVAAALAGLVLVAQMSSGLRHGAGFTIAYLAGGAIVSVAAAHPVRARLSGGIRLLAATGRVSYPLYLWHASIGAMMRSAFPDQPVLACATSLIGSFVIAAVIHSWIEQPVETWCRSRRRNTHHTSIAIASALHQAT